MMLDNRYNALDKSLCEECDKGISNQVHMIEYMRTTRYLQDKR